MNSSAFTPAVRPGVHKRAAAVDERVVRDRGQERGRRRGGGADKGIDDLVAVAEAAVRRVGEHHRAEVARDCAGADVVDGDDGAGGNGAGRGPAERGFTRIERGAVPLVVLEVDGRAACDRFKHNKGQVVVAIGIETGERDRARSERHGKISKDVQIGARKRAARNRSPAREARNAMVWMMRPCRTEGRGWMLFVSPALTFRFAL